MTKLKDQKYPFNSKFSIEPFVELLGSDFLKIYPKYFEDIFIEINNLYHLG